MKRNTYVTAALFVVFALLTVAYWNMDAPREEEVPMTTSLNPVNEMDVVAAGDVADNEEDVDAEEGNASDEQVDAEAGETENNDESDREVMSSLDTLRAEIEEGRTQQVASLTEIIASSDFDAETKSAARDSLNEIESLANNGRALESVIRNMGFDDVLVRANAEFVQVTVQVSSMDAVPTREELAELYILAGIQFGSHRNGNISIDFQPLN